MIEVSESIIQQAANIIGADGIAEDEMEARVRALVADDITARRLIDWIPEVFGMVLVAHMNSRVHLPETFSAKTVTGHWRTLKLTAEPIIPEALILAQRIYHDGPQGLFRNLSLRSSILGAVNNLLHNGGSLDGAVCSGPGLIGIPAETYPNPKKPTWVGFILGLFRRKWSDKLINYKANKRMQGNRRSAGA